MARLHQYAKHQGVSVDVEGKIIEHTFNLIMQGKKEAYDDAILRALHTLSAEEKSISVAQLSMVDAAQRFEDHTAITILHPLKSLVDIVKSTIK